MNIPSSVYLSVIFGYIYSGGGDDTVKFIGHHQSKGMSQENLWDFI
jgi:hypothetical protein